MWWLPEVMRMRAAYDDGQAAVLRLQAAVEMASGHGSVALLRRCERDLAARGVIPPAGSVLPDRLTASGGPRTLRERRPP